MNISEMINILKNILEVLDKIYHVLKGDSDERQ